MVNNDKLPYLSEIIDLERDILPYRAVLLHAGVGAGKNTWTRILAKKGYHDKKINKKQYGELKADLNKILKAFDPAAIPCTYPIKSLGRALPYFGYSVTTFGRNGAN